jgi:hypothetical protein
LGASSITAEVWRISVHSNQGTTASGPGRLTPVGPSHGSSEERNHCHPAWRAVLLSDTRVFSALMTWPPQVAEAGWGLRDGLTNLSFCRTFYRASDLDGFMSNTKTVGWEQTEIGVKCLSIVVTEMKL